MISNRLAAWLSARDIHYGWVVAGTTFLTMLATAGAMGSAGVLLQPLEQEFGWHRVPNLDRRIVAGVATYALEFLRNCPELETVYVPIGMGSGICGTIAVRNALGLATKVVGVVSSKAPAYALSFAAGDVREHAVSQGIADGLACRKPVAEALDLMKAGMERIIIVEDDEVEDAMRAYFMDTHNVAEGAGGAGLAALLKDREQGGVRVGTVLTGGNVDSEAFGELLCSVALA